MWPSQRATFQWPLYTVCVVACVCVCVYVQHQSNTAPQSERSSTLSNGREVPKRFVIKEMPKVVSSSNWCSLSPAGHFNRCKKKKRRGKETVPVLWSSQTVAQSPAQTVGFFPVSVAVCCWRYVGRLTRGFLRFGLLLALVSCTTKKDRTTMAPRKAKTGMV